MKTSKIFEDLKSLSPQFTGERYTIGAGVRIAYEHFNRYCFALNNLNQGDTVLDLACGSGYGSILLAQKVKSVYAADIDLESLNLLNKVCQMHNINNVKPLNVDINQLETNSDLKNAKITAVICHELIEHISSEQQKGLLKKISTSREIFTENCKFFVSTPERDMYNSVNIKHNEFHLAELTKNEFIELVSSNFKNSKFFWQKPISGDLILPFQADDNNSQSISYLNWADSNNLIAYPQQESPEVSSGIYMYAVASNTELNLNANSSLIVDPENKELLERFVIAAEELRAVKENANQVNVNEVQALDADLKILTASSKKIKNLIFETEKIAAEKVLLETKLKELETIIAPFKAANLSEALNERILSNPELISEAISYYDLRQRFAHRIGNYILFKLQRKKPVMVLNRFYKFFRLVLNS